MKLRYLFVLPILATALIGCDEIEEPTGKPVENPQLPGITQADFAVTPLTALEGVMNLDELSGQTDDPEAYMIDLYSIDVLTDALPESAVVLGGLQLSATEDFANPFDVDNIVMTDGVASAPLKSFLYIRSQMYKNDPREYPIFYRVPVYVDLDGGRYKIGDKDSFFCVGNYFLQEGEDPGYTVEEAYYLVGPDGDALNTAVKFNHSGYNVYDDTVFTLQVKFGATNSSWVVVPESVYESGNLDLANCYGPADATALEGTLDLGKKGSIEGGKRYDFSIDLSTLTYTIHEIADFEYLYTPGAANDWSQTNSQMLWTDDHTTYQGYAYINGEFKFSTAPNWDGINYGEGSAEGTISPTGENLKAEEGLYWVVVNVDKLTYTLTPITKIGMIGAFNDWGGDEDLTSTDHLIWTGTLTLASDDANQWKFRMNGGWDLNLGAAGDVEPVEVTPAAPYEGLVGNGKNLASPAGTYTVTLDLSTLPYSCTLVAK